MNFNLSEEQTMLVDAARRYVRERCGFQARRDDAHRPGGFSLERWREFAEMGWLALPVEEAAGGLGAGCVDVALLMEEFGAGLVNLPYTETVVLCGALLAHSVSPRARLLLDGIVAGDCILALAHIEGSGRSEYDTPVTCRATANDNGWRLQGSKTRVFHGAAATHWLVSARLGDGAEVGVFVVDRDTENVRIVDHTLIDGTHAAELDFDRAELSGDALLLSGTGAMERLHDALDRAVLALSAAALGSMESVMAMTADYLKTRVQYGQPLARFQALQHRMAEMLVETEQARGMLFRALAASEAGDAEASRRAISGAKSLIARAGYFVTAQGIQLHGGIGTTEEFAIGHHYKAMLVYDKRFGDADFHLARSAGLPF